MMLKRVVFPAPFGPMTPVISPSPTLKETSSRAVTPPKTCLTPRTSSMTRLGTAPAELAQRSGNPTDQPAGDEHRHQHEEKAVEDDVVIVHEPEELGEKRQERRAQEGAVNAPETADHHH